MLLLFAQAGSGAVFAASFILYTLLIVGVGLWSARYARRSDEDYFLAGRSLGPWMAALSASASSESGWVTLGLVGWAFTSGVSAYWIIPGCLLGFLFNWLVIAPRLRDRALASGALTIPDFIAFSFDSLRVPLRVLSVIVILVAMLLYVAAQFAAAGKAFEAAFTTIDYRLGVLIGAGIVLAYTVLGGFRAACWTDMLQGLIMVGTLVIFPAWLLVKLGGVGFITGPLEGVTTAGGHELLRFMPDLAGPALIGFLLGSGALGINFGYPGQPHVLVRFMALRERRAAIAGAAISVSWALLIYLGAVTIGLIARAATEAGVPWTLPLAAELQAGVPDAGERGLVLAARELVPGVFSGMVLAAVLAAICSTADSQLVVAASSAANDLYARLIDRSRRTAHLLVNRLVVLTLGAVAVVLVINGKVNVYSYVLTYGWAILGAAFGPQIILILLWRGATAAGCLAGMCTGFVVAIAWQRLSDAEMLGAVEIYNLPVAFVAALVVNVVVSKVTKVESRK